MKEKNSISKAFQSVIKKCTRNKSQIEKLGTEITDKLEKRYYKQIELIDRVYECGWSISFADNDNINGIERNFIINPEKYLSLSDTGIDNIFMNYYGEKISYLWFWNT